ncbi:MAG: hypothetical protein KBA67_01705 [Leptotrichiaceae bacterium]|nr:hypothetical protein [Leptotrichiaceae bacterium]MBP6280879.1 hypothetical protein [Leptotrichiaceae bacterium]MBP7100224.1 hypothetical protein [Leptotrichiaceae bacterium]MBP7739585.1 hypothetical protein [Leptotrichiaceae bacterium]MBP9629946.1 hypothetical protein [Leptotrichiaceae bacterium]
MEELMKKILLVLLIFSGLNLMGTSKPSIKSENAKVEIKKFKSLKDAAKDYEKVLQEVSNYGSRELLQTINPEVDQYVKSKNDEELTKKWEESNTMLIEQFEVSVQKVNEYKELGDVTFLIKGYDEKVLEKYLSDNVSQYAKVNEKGEIEIEIEKYIELQYEYLKNTAKINLATSRVDFVKSSDGWRVIEQNQKK